MRRATNKIRCFGCLSPYGPSFRKLLSLTKKDPAQNRICVYTHKLTRKYSLCNGHTQMRISAPYPLRDITIQPTGSIHSKSIV